MPPTHPIRAIRRLLALTVAVLASTALLACSPTATSAPPSPAPAAPTSPGWRLPDPSGEPLPRAQAAAMAAEVQRWVDGVLLTGVTVAVVTDRGTWAGAAGKDGAGTPLVPEAGMAVASITKTFVSAAVLRLVEEGRVDLDASAATYVDHPLLARDPTVRQLLSMRSGVPSPDPSIWEDIIAEPDRRWTALEVLERAVSPAQPPGRRFVYENDNYVLLGLLVEAVTGRTLGDVVREDLWRPLGLERIAFQDTDVIAPPRAVAGPDGELPPGLATADGMLPWRSLATAVGASGGAAADATTIARWGYLLYGGHVLGEATTRALRESALEDGYGLGSWRIGVRDMGTEVVGHNGDLPGYKTVLATFPERRASIAILTTGVVAPEPYVAHLAKAGGLLPPPPS